MLEAEEGRVKVGGYLERMVVVEVDGVLGEVFWTPAVAQSFVGGERDERILELTYFEGAKEGGGWVVVSIRVYADESDCLWREGVVRIRWLTGRERGCWRVHRGESRREDVFP